MKKWAMWTLGAVAAAALLAGDALLTRRLVTERMNRACGAPAYSAPAGDPIAAFRLAREQLRARQEAQLNDIVHDPGSDGQIVADAQGQLLSMLACARAETDLEGILRSRGFEDALVSVSAAAANVLVRGEDLTREESAVILDLVMRETGLTGGNVKIIPVK